MGVRRYGLGTLSNRLGPHVFKLGQRGPSPASSWVSGAPPAFQVGSAGPLPRFKFVRGAPLPLHRHARSENSVDTEIHSEHLACRRRESAA
jgi:hypothetical protein